MSRYIRPPDDVYWHFRRLPSDEQVGAEWTSVEDGLRYYVRGDRRICQIGIGEEAETIDSIPSRLPAGAQVLTGVRWGFHMPISVFYQRVIGPSGSPPKTHS